KNVYAAGDCSETLDYISGKNVYRPLGSVALESGGIAGENLAGRKTPHPGNLRIQSDRVFGVKVASIGLTLAEAARLGLEASYLKLKPPKEVLKETVEMRVIVGKKDNRILGFQALGGDLSTRFSELALKAIREGRTLGWLEAKGFKTFE
ncbi:MAG: hypothetical protein DRO46_01205, partial [Candidatus Hecatellales archaeon]